MRLVAASGSCDGKLLLVAALQGMPELNISAQWRSQHQFGLVPLIQSITFAIAMIHRPRQMLRRIKTLGQLIVQLETVEREARCRSDASRLSATSAGRAAYRQGGPQPERAGRHSLSPGVTGPHGVEPCWGPERARLVSLSHLALVCGKRSQNLLFLPVGHLEEVKCSAKFSCDFIKLRGRNLQFAMGYF